MKSSISIIAKTSDPSSRQPRIAAMAEYQRVSPELPYWPNIEDTLAMEEGTFDHMQELSSDGRSELLDVDNTMRELGPRQQTLHEQRLLRGPPAPERTSPPSRLQQHRRREVIFDLKLRSYHFCLLSEPVIPSDYTGHGMLWKSMIGVVVGVAVWAGIPALKQRLSG